MVMKHSDAPGLQGLVAAVAVAARGRRQRGGRRVVGGNEVGKVLGGVVRRRAHVAQRRKVRQHLEPQGDASTPARKPRVMCAQRPQKRCVLGLARSRCAWWTSGGRAGAHLVAGAGVHHLPLVQEHLRRRARKAAYQPAAGAQRWCRAAPLFAATERVRGRPRTTSSIISQMEARGWWMDTTTVCPAAARRLSVAMTCAHTHAEQGRLPAWRRRQSGFPSRPRSSGAPMHAHAREASRAPFRRRRRPARWWARRGR